MFQGLQESQLAGAIEAMLFVTDEPVGALALADMLEVEPSEVERALVDLRTRLEEENRGIQLREVAGGWRLYTHPVYHGLIEKYVLSWDTRKLSQAALETLAVVAYSQPVTRAGVAAIRGVNSDSSISSLVEKGLVREAGVADTPGNPTLYATTRAFLEKFGLRTVRDLPDLADFAPDDETRALIRERLSATQVDDAQGDEGLPEGEADSPLSALAFEIEDDDEGLFSVSDAQPIGDARLEDGTRLVEDERGEQAMVDSRDALADAMASALGTVEKIDFSTLTFETDDE